MSLNVVQKLIHSHLLHGTMKPGAEIGLRIDQTLTQDATGTLVMLELEAMGLDRVKTEISVQYVDHNLIQEDYKNPDDHLFLRSACQRFGIWYSRDRGNTDCWRYLAKEEAARTLKEHGPVIAQWIAAQ